MADNDGKVIDFVNNKSIEFADYLKEDEYLEFITLDTLKRLNKNSKEGVRSIQRQYGLKPDGTVGHNTFSIIFEYLDIDTANEVIEHMKSEGYYMDKNDNSIKKHDKKNKSKIEIPINKNYRKSYSIVGINLKSDKGEDKDYFINCLPDIYNFDLINELNISYKDYIYEINYILKKVKEKIYENY